MRIIKLYGVLGKKFGKIHRFDVKSPGEAIRALCANFPEFKEFMLNSDERKIGFRVFNGMDELNEEKQVNDVGVGHIKFVPVVIGANAGTRILVGSVLVVAGLVATAYGVPGGNFLISAGATMVLGGVAELISPVPKVKGPEEKPENKPSYLFNGPVNTMAQGHPVPIGYGRLRVGGGVISASITVDQIMTGFVKKVVSSTIDVLTFNHKEYQPPIPDNFFRKEFLRASGPAGRIQYWYRIHYYETITVRA